MNLPMADTPQVPGYPRPIVSVHQIEVTTHCNLRCRYCPSPKLEQHRGQPKTHMTRDVFERALHWASHFEANGSTQGELSLTGIGETLLHPDWKTFVRLARKALPSNYINFSTNGLLLDEDACKHLAEHNVSVYVSLHRPEKAGPAIEIAKRYGVIDDVNASASISAFDWAGQVDWYVSAPASLCEWLRDGWCNVLVDGRITRCCLDASGKGVMGTVNDEPGTLTTGPYSLCTGCHQTIEEPAT